MSDLDHFLDAPPPLGEQSPSAEDLEISKLRAQVAELEKELDLTQTERNNFRFAADSFREEVAHAVAHAERPRGGQSVSPTGDFVHVQPSVLGRLRWWAERFDDASGFTYAVETLTAERDGARAEAAAAKRERDVARLALEELKEDAKRYANAAFDAAVLAEREACAKETEAIGERWLGRGAAAFVEVASAIRARGKRPRSVEVVVFPPKEDTVPRPPGCQCQLEEGDSPCPVHGGGK